MDWEKVDIKLKRKLDKNFVACSEKWELRTIKEVILEEFRQFSEYEVEEAIKDCCEEVKPPRPRKAFLECLKRKLKL